MMEKRGMARGFTLIEMMAAVGIFGILLAFAIPPIYQSMDTVSGQQSAEALGGRLRLARSQALSGYANVIVYFNRDGVGTYTVHIDNGGGTGIPGDPGFDIANKNNGLVDNGEQVSTPVELAERTVFGYVPGGMTSGGEFLDAAIGFDGNPPRVTFRADGTSDANGWVAVMPLVDFLEQNPGRDFAVEVASSTGEIRVLRIGY